MGLHMDTGRALRELWSFHQMFMRLGFGSDELFVAPSVLDQQGHSCVGLHVRRGAEELNVSVGIVPDVRELLRKWPAYVERMNAAPHAEQDCVYRESMALKLAGELVNVLMRKGGSFAAAVAGVGGLSGLRQGLS